MPSDDPTATVREIWSAWSRGGGDAVLETVPDDVEWQAYGAPGETFRGAEIREYWQRYEQRGQRMEADLFDVEQLDDSHVLATGSLRTTGRGGSRVDQVAWLYSFRDGRLSRVSGHPSASEARAAARRMHADRMAQRVTPALTIVTDPPATMRLSGELDLAGAPGATAVVEQLRARGAAEIVLDLTALEFMDSTGLRMLLHLTRAATEDGWTLRIHAGAGAARRVIDVAGVAPLLPLGDG